MDAWLSCGPTNGDRSRFACTGYIGVRGGPGKVAFQVVTAAGSRRWGRRGSRPEPKRAMAASTSMAAARRIRTTATQATGSAVTPDANFVRTMVIRPQVLTAYI